MNFEQLEIFIAVADCGSFTKAAEAMYISHSTTSRNVAALEESLGVRLLDRDSRSVRLTPAGELLYREGGELLESFRRLTDRLRSISQSPHGSLSVASVNMISPAVSERFRVFCAEYPEIVLGIRHRELSQVLSQVASGGADVGISFSYALGNEMQEYEVYPIEASRFCAVVPENHPLACRKSLKIAELRDYAYVSVGEQRSRFTKEIEQAVLKDRPAGDILSVPTLESLFLQVRSGNGVSVAPLPMVKRYADGCAAIDIEDEDTAFDVTAFWRRDNDNPALELFGRFLSGENRALLEGEI